MDLKRDTCPIGITSGSGPTGEGLAGTGQPSPALQGSGQRVPNAPETKGCSSRDEGKSVPRAGRSRRSRSPSNLLVVGAVTEHLRNEHHSCPRVHGTLPSWLSLFEAPVSPLTEPRAAGSGPRPHGRRRVGSHQAATGAGRQGCGLWWWLGQDARQTVSKRGTQGGSEASLPGSTAGERRREGGGPGPGPSPPPSRPSRCIWVSGHHHRR